MLSTAPMPLNSRDLYQRLRRSVIWVGLTLLVSFGSGRVWADNDGPPRFHDVKAWRGSLVASAKALDERGGAGWEAINPWKSGVSFQAVFSVDFILTEYEDEPSVWTGRVVSSNLDASYRGVAQGLSKDGAIVENFFNTSGPLENSEKLEAKLAFHRERGWSVHVETPKRETEYTEIITIKDKKFTERRQVYAYGLNGTETLPYPEKRMVLFASGQKTEGGDASNAATLPFEWDYTIYLEPTELEELRLVIEEPKDYARWRPETTPAATAGPEMAVVARLETVSGGQPKTRVEKFVWELQGTSREPGVVMNYPVAPTESRLDIELSATGEMFLLSEDKQRVERAVREGFSDTVAVVPYDWGGWSTLQVSAILSDGRMISGKLKGKQDLGLRVPKRKPGSHIADGWKEKNKSGADDLDDDNEPLGDGTKGDGLTLYEEYRGFYVAGKRVEGSPKTKDYFVDISRAGFALLGVERFRRDTRLAVHQGLSETDLSPTRVINANHKLGAHNADQHAIVVRVGSEADFSLTVGGPGNPKMISSVDLIANAWSDAVSSNARKTHRIDSTVAHELGHTVNIWHHGETDPGFVRWTVKNGFLYEGAEKIEVQNSNGVVLTDDIIGIVNGMKRGYLQGWRAAPAEKSGQHSGNDSCIMRYWCAQTFEIMPGWRMADFDEPIGDFLCSSPQGTGINESGGLHGNAATNRGACSKQILVTDDANAPTR